VHAVVVGRIDLDLDTTELLRACLSYDRVGATVTEIEGSSHVAMISHPKEIAQVVTTAVRTCAARST
jgi:hypothetical protein